MVERGRQHDLKHLRRIWVCRSECKLLFGDLSAPSESCNSNDASQRSTRFLKNRFVLGAAEVEGDEVEGIGRCGDDAAERTEAQSPKLEDATTKNGCSNVATRLRNDPVSIAQNKAVGLEKL